MYYSDLEDIYCVVVIIKRFLREFLELILIFKFYDIIVNSIRKYFI